MYQYIGKINRGYQFTLPQKFRDAYHLQVGDYLSVHEADGKLVIEPVTLVSKKPDQALKSLLNASHAFDELSEEEIMDLVQKEVKKHRQESKSKSRKGKMLGESHS